MSPIDHIEMHTEDLKALLEDLADQIEAASMLSNKEDVAKAAEQAARKLAHCSALSRRPGDLSRDVEPASG